MNQPVPSIRNARFRVGHVTCVPALMALLVVSNAVGEQSTANTPGPTDATNTSAAGIGDSIAEIIVTAQRRGENLQNVPVTVSAITADAAARMGVTNTTDLTAAVPGLDFSRQNSVATPFIRGVGATSALIGNEAPVATYVDGVYISEPAGALFALSNIDRIEVLKGPQGTLFGRNATGGVVQVITKDPTQETHVDVAVGYGNYRTTTESVYATTGITQDLAADIAIYSSYQSKGWGRDVTTGVDAFTSRDYTGRTKWVWTPTNATKAKLSLDFGVSQGEAGVGGSPLPGTLGLDGVTSNSGFYNTAGSPNDYYRSTQYGGALDLEHDFGWARLVSLSAMRRYRVPYLLDQDATPVPFIGAQINGENRSFSQEIQLLSTSTGRVQWIAGVYYLDDLSGYQPLALSGLALQGLPYADTYTKQTVRSYSGFGQSTVEVVDATHLTLGIRYTSDHRGEIGDTVVPIGPGGSPVVTGVVSQSAVFSKPTWRVALDHQFTPDFMSYLSYNRGFKSGVYDSLSYKNPPVKPEILDAYEVGIKSESFDKRVRVNSSAFFYNYSNIQVDQIENGVSTLLNAAKARLYGVDLDVTVVPLNRLTVTSAMEFLHGRYTSFPNAPLFEPSPIGGNVSLTRDATGRTSVHSPPFTGNLTVSYAYPVPQGNLDFAVSNYYDTGFYWNADNRLKQPAYDLLNTSITWTAPKGDWNARVWGKNLLARRYYSFETDEQFGDIASPAPPLTYGITVGYRF